MLLLRFDPGLDGDADPPMGQHGRPEQVARSGELQVADGHHGQSDRHNGAWPVATAALVWYSRRVAVAAITRGN